MERDDFIIVVYLLICELYQEFLQRYCPHGSLRRGGFAPALSDEEVICMEIFGEYFKLHTDQDLFDYFYCHYQDYFPNLSDRPAFIFMRQAANLWQAYDRSNSGFSSGQCNSVVLTKTAYR